MGRPPLRPGTHGSINVTRTGGVHTARTLYRRFDGGYQRLKASGSTPTAAEYALKERIALGIETATEGDLTGSTPLSTVADVWLDEVEREGRLAPQTLELYRDNLQRVVVPALGQLRLNELSVGRLDRFLKGQAEIATSRAKLARTVLSQMLGLAVRHDALVRNPVAGTAPVKRAKKDVVALDLQQLAAVREAVRTWRTGPEVRGPKQDGQLAQIFDVILGTSGRIGEALAIRVPEDLELDGDRLLVTISGTVIPYKTKNSGLVRQDYRKGSKDWQVITVPKFTEQAIRERLERRGAFPDGAPLFCTRNGTLLSPSNVRRQWRAIRAELGEDALGGLDLESITPHTLRKTVATTLEQAEAGGLELAAQMLGHSSSSVTRQHYIQGRRRVDPITAEILERLGSTQPPNEGLGL